MNMRRLRESFEYLAGISNDQNDLINRGKIPKGFQLLDVKDSAREERDNPATVLKNPKQGFFGMDLLKFRHKKQLAKLHHIDEDFNSYQKQQHMLRMVADPPRTIDEDDEVNVHQYNTHSNLKQRNQDTPMEVELIGNPYESITNYVMEGHAQKQ